MCTDTNTVPWRYVYRHNTVPCMYVYRHKYSPLKVCVQTQIQSLAGMCTVTSYKDHVTDKEVCAKIRQAIRPHEDLLTIVKTCKLKWYGHVSRASDLATTILQSPVKGGRRQGRHKIYRHGETSSETGQAWSLPSPRGRWRTEENGCEINCSAPTSPEVKRQVKRYRHRYSPSHVHKHTDSDANSQSCFQQTPHTDNV